MADPMTEVSATSERAALFDRVYDAELGYVWNSLRRLGVPGRDLEDLAHDVFVVVHRKLDDLDRARPIKPWLFGIAFRVASERRRRSSTRQEELHAEPDDSILPDANARDDARIARDAIDRALANLDEDQRAVFVLHDLDEVPVPEIATALGIPLNTAYSRLRLARGNFREAIERARARGEV